MMDPRIKYPSLKKKFDAIIEAVSWAGGLRCVYVKSKEADVIDKTEVWGELSVVSLVTGDTQAVDFEDDNETGDAENPRQEMMVMRVDFVLQLAVCSRSQEIEQSGWKGALVTQLRLSYPFVAARYFTPNGLKYVPADGIDDGDHEFDNRIEDRALMEIGFTTFIADMDTGARGTWIEQVEVTSEFTNMNPGLNWDKELIP